MSPHTLHSYRDAIRRLLTFAATRYRRSVAELSLDELGRETVLAFLEHLETQRGNAVATRNARLAAIHSLYRFIAAEEPAALALAQQVLAIPYKHGPARAVICLPRADIEHLLGSIDQATPLGRRDVALLHFLYNTGARAQEVVDVRLPAVRSDAPAQVRLWGKGQKECLCPLWPETIALLRTMLTDRGGALTSDVPLFVNATGRPLTRFGLGHIVRTRAAAATVSRPTLAKTPITPHSFRHATALHVLPAGIDLNCRPQLARPCQHRDHSRLRPDRLGDEARGAEGLCASRPADPRATWTKPDPLAWLEAL